MIPDIRNSRGQRLDMVVEGEDTDLIVVFAHGLGTSKHEFANLFDDIAHALRLDTRTVRFDFAGYGQSEGKQEEMSLDSMADDLQSVLNWVQETFPGRIMIIAHSLGTLVTSLLSPDGIERTMYTGIPRPDNDDTIAAIRDRLLARGGDFNPTGTSIYPRKDGTRQKLGAEFWRSLEIHDPVEMVRAFALKTELTIIKPIEDELIGGPEQTKAFAKIPGVTMIELHGDHNFTKPRQRTALLKKIHQLVTEYA